MFRSWVQLGVQAVRLGFTISAAAADLFRTAAVTQENGLVAAGCGIVGIVIGISAHWWLVRPSIFILSELDSSVFKARMLERRRRRRRRTSEEEKSGLV